MDMSFTVEVKGINEVIKRIRKLGDEVAEDADKVMGYSARAIEREAKKNAPTGVNSQLKASGDVIDKFLNKEVVFRSKHAPFQEFGTKSKVEIPQGLEQYAMQFKSSGGSFKKLLESIKEWCNKKGIDSDFAYPIALRIAQNGVAAQPFLFPAYFKEIPKTRKNLEKVVRKKRE